MKDQFEFDKDSQQINVRRFYYGKRKEKIFLQLEEGLKHFVHNSKDLISADEVEEYFGYFDINNYFLTFMELLHLLIAEERIKIPKGINLSTKFTPCRVCKNTENLVAINVRCKHKIDCEEHLKKMHQPEYEENCNCENYTSPCLSFSKIGVVLHLEFVNEDNTVTYMDVDINPPSIPVSKRLYQEYPQGPVIEEEDYDGSNTDKRAWLEEHRPINWKTEWDKSEDMSEAAADGLMRCVRLRFHNHHDVLAEQVQLLIKIH